jgi:lipopolysaccharide export LptBFGC system permease protein LptF
MEKHKINLISISRLQFLNKLIRGLLVAFLAFLAFALGSKAVKGNNCNSCPGNGICRGETDCSKY